MELSGGDLDNVIRTTMAKAGENGSANNLGGRLTVAARRKSVANDGRNRSHGCRRSVLANLG
jgi:hypothetical protein